MRRAALLDMLKATFGQYTSEVGNCEEMEDLAKCKSHVARDYITPNFKASKAEVRDSPLYSTSSEQRDEPALEMFARLTGGRARLGIEFEVARDNKNITECSILENIVRITLQSAQSSCRPFLAAHRT